MTLHETLRQLSNFTGNEVADYATNYDLENICTPIKVEVLQDLLYKTNYNKDDAEFLIQGFTHGFDVGYQGPRDRKCVSRNLPITVGSHVELWNKLIKEVRAKRVAGPFDEIPFNHYIQSPIGLVPKDGGVKTRLIFHLSYDFGPDECQKSVNYFTPDHLAKVKYRDLDYAVKLCLEITGGEGVYFARTDVCAAFRLVPLLKSCWNLLIMKAKNPCTGKYMYFSDKSLPFGSRRSCALFQKFSDALTHLVECLSRRNRVVTNYLDDFLFIAETEKLCNALVSNFIKICQRINCPLAAEKTEMATQYIVFLGIMLDGEHMYMSIPIQKRNKALFLLKLVSGKNRATVGFLETLTGLLNFLGRAIFPGRAFTRRMYAKFTGKTVNKDGKKLKKHHHVKIDSEFKFDCCMWRIFLARFQDISLCRPFIDVNCFETSQTLQFYTDASQKIGYGCFFNGRWLHGVWEKDFNEKYSPSIQYLELYALCAGVLTWGKELSNTRVVIFCDNDSVKNMVNHITSSCQQCMVLLRLLVLNGLVYNRRVFVKHIRTHVNILADSLSRRKFRTFWKHAPSHTHAVADKLTDALPPISQLWLYH